MPEQPESLDKQNTSQVNLGLHFPTKQTFGNDNRGPREIKHTQVGLLVQIEVCMRQYLVRVVQ